MEGGRQEGQSGGWRLSLVLPAFNEQEVIAQAVTEADRDLSSICLAHEIIVVDDGSSDQTATIVTTLAAGNPRVRLLRHAGNQGYGAALRTGFEAATFDLVAFTDADCQFHLADLARLLAVSPECHLAVGYRVDRKDPLRRRLFSWGYNVIARGLLGTGVRDCDCALKVFRRPAALQLLPNSHGFFVNTEMLTDARQGGLRVAECPVRHRPRLQGCSKVSLHEIPKTLAALLPFWWSKVLFREKRHDGAPALAETLRIAPSSVGQLALIVVAAALLFFGRLNCPLQEPEETRYAEISRQMLVGGNYLTPELNDLKYFDKPPLLYWLTMGCYGLFGVHDWSARLASAGAGFLTVLLVYFWAGRTLGPAAAFWAALMICLSARFVFLSRLLTMNSLLSFLVTGTFAAAHLALTSGGRRRLWWLISGIACGLGLLTKGPVVLALVVPPVVLFAWLDKRSQAAQKKDWTLFLAATFAVAGPWYIWAALQEPGFAGYFFWKHNLLRYLAPFDHAKPVWFYLGDCLLGMFPWSILLPLLIAACWRRREGGALHLPPAVGFGLIAFSWTFLFFSMAGSKRSGYILPAMPLLAFSLGGYLNSLLALLTGQQGERALEWLGKLALRLSVVVVGVGMMSFLIAYEQGLLKGPAFMSLLATGLITGASIAIHRGRFRPALSWKLCGLSCFIVLLGAIHFGLPGYARHFSMRGQVRPFAAVASNAEVPVVCFPRGWDSVSFYLGRKDVLTFSADQRNELVAFLCDHPQTLAFIKSQRALEQLLRHLPGSLEFVPQGRQGNVAAGWVRPRYEVPRAFYAGR
jgi:dolichol-phosphate mannosyltransferase